MLPSKSTCNSKGSRAIAYKMANMSVLKYWALCAGREMAVLRPGTGPLNRHECCAIQSTRIALLLPKPDDKTIREEPAFSV